MSIDIEVVELHAGLHLFRDTCNVYVMSDANESVVVDFGSGRWVAAAAEMGLPPLSHVYLTHHHADQCSGLLRLKSWPFTVHAPVGEDAFYSKDGVRMMRDDMGGAKWFPKSYNLLEKGLAPGLVVHDMASSGFAYHFGNQRFNFVSTPGHGPYAMSVLTEHNGLQIAFCGDAAHAGATIHQPHNLEWDHWTAKGAVAAADGVRRLHNVGLDLLLPAHGPVIDTAPRQVLAELLNKLSAFIEAKGCPCAGEPDRYVPPQRLMDCGAIEIAPGLFWYNNGGYLLLSASGEALITDPFGDLEIVDALLAELGGDITISAQVVTHVHADHMGGVDVAREKYGCELWLHPVVAKILARERVTDIPYVLRDVVEPDHLWPEDGEWRWNEFTFSIALMPGQTWWHCGFMTTVDGRKVLFGGDTFQPPSRWNGTGGFCSINGCRFREGVRRTAERILQWQPDIIVNGHSTWMHYSPSYFKRVIEWADRAEQATAALCPSGDLNTDYYLHTLES